MGSLDNCPPVTFNWQYEGENGLISVFPVVVDYLHVPPWNGSVHSCPSDVDWYGYTDLDWDIKEVIFFPEDEKKVEIRVDVNKQNLTKEQLDSVEQRVLQFCSMVSQDEFYDESVVCMDYERNDNA